MRPISLALALLLLLAGGGGLVGALNMRDFAERCMYARGDDGYEKREE